MEALDQLNDYQHFMLGTRNAMTRSEVMDAEIEAARSEPAVEREDPTIGNEELLRGLPLFLEFRTEEGKLGLRGRRKSGIGGTMRGTRPGDSADRVHETITSMPTKRLR